MSANRCLEIALALSLAGLLLALGACGSPAAPTSTPGHQLQTRWPLPATASASGSTAPVDEGPPPTTGSSCAGDAAWIRALGQPPPLRSTLMRFDGMRSRGGFGPPGPVTTFNEFGGVTRSSEEKYEWKPAKPQGSNLQLVVLRGATGPIPRSYDVPRKLRSGVLEHPQRRRQGVFAGVDEPSTLFVFPDGTWMRTKGQLAERVRANHALTGTPPPVPSADPDVAWEICGAVDPNDLSLPYDIWTIRGNRVAARLFASRPEGELVYSFDSPALAAQAAADQQVRCGQAGCPWVKISRAEGPMVRFGIAVRKAPTSQRNVLEIAHTTPRLAAPPPANAPAVPGKPPSGVYQQFVDIRADTCPTRSAGQTFPSMYDLILLTHDNGKAFTTLESQEPRAPGILTASQVPNVELKVGTVVRKEARHLCPNYTIAREMTVLAVTGNLIRVRDVVRHVGSTAGCRHQSLPSNCHHEAVTTWVLARKVCDAHCDASYEGRWQSSSNQPAPAIDATCSCP